MQRDFFEEMHAAPSKSGFRVPYKNILLFGGLPAAPGFESLLILASYRNIATTQGATKFTVARPWRKRSSPGPV